MHYQSWEWTIGYWLLFRGFPKMVPRLNHPLGIFHEINMLLGVAHLSSVQIPLSFHWSLVGLLRDSRSWIFPKNTPNVWKVAKNPLWSSSNRALGHTVHMLKMTMKIVDLPMKNVDFPWISVCFPLSCRGHSGSLTPPNLEAHRLAEPRWPLRVLSFSPQREHLRWYL